MKKKMSLKKSATTGNKKAVTSKKKMSAILLPTKKNIPSTDLADYSILLYGAMKIGKTSLASMFPNAFFMSFEPGTKALEVYASDVPRWEDAIALVDQLEEGKHPFRTIVVDTIDIMYERAWDYICRKERIKDPADMNDYGATYKAIEDEFTKLFMRIIFLEGCGCIFLSHDEEKEITLRDGSKVDRVQPTMHKRALKVVKATVDIIANYAYYGKQRILKLDGAEESVGGQRLPNNFRTTSGEKVSSIDMGKDEKEAYSNFIKGFENKLTQDDATVAKEASTKKRASLRKVTRSVK